MSDFKILAELRNSTVTFRIPTSSTKRRNAAPLTRTSLVRILPVTRGWLKILLPSARQLPFWRRRTIAPIRGTPIRGAHTRRQDDAGNVKAFVQLITSLERSLGECHPYLIVHGGFSLTFQAHVHNTKAAYRRCPSMSLASHGA
jgi:hypothetical protein